MVLQTFNLDKIQGYFLFTKDLFKMQMTFYKFTKTKYFSMKHLYTLLIFCAFSNLCYGQSYFGLNYQFWKYHRGGDTLSFYAVNPDTTLTVVGYSRDASGILTPNIYAPTIHKRFDKRTQWGPTLKGYITAQSADTLTVAFWSIIDTDQASPDTIQKSNWDDNYIFIMPKESRQYSFPFKSTVLVATNIPLRIQMDRQVDAQFLNLGVSFLRVWGRTVFYRNDNIAPKSWFFGVGAFASLTTISFDSSDTRGALHQSTTTAGIVYGGNLIFSYINLSLTFAAGLEDAFGKNSSSWQYQNHPWIGFGVGYKFYDLSFGGNNAKK
jgi:hypothetical protein